ncbi:MAG: molybdopterin converting factor subunit 1 [Kiloniellales bacterium]|nr:molybdopterin converting factor subunit 1 [Kiloniellales bacterium]
MRLLYFAWVKAKTGTAEEEVEVPQEVRDVSGLLDWMESRGPRYAEAFSDRAAIRVAVNQEFARPGDPVAPGDEVAFFPPVTGG